MDKVEKKRQKEQYVVEEMIPSAPFGNSSPIFKVFTLRKKYNRWHTHTITIHILSIDTTIYGSVYLFSVICF